MTIFKFRKANFTHKKSPGLFLSGLPYYSKNKNIWSMRRKFDIWAGSSEEYTYDISQGRDEETTYYLYGKNFEYSGQFIKSGLVKYVESDGESSVNSIQFIEPIQVKYLANWMSRRNWHKKLLKGDDIIHGGKSADKIWGGPGDDKIYGKNGHDKLWGGPGDDTIHGGNGQDFIDGGKGDDVIVAGKSSAKKKGFQTAKGGPGRDTFVLSEHAEVDILDFNTEEDRLNFAGIKGFKLQREGKKSASVRDEDGYWYAWLNGGVDNINAIDVIY